MKNQIELLDPSKHPDWLAPHSIEWYKQLGEMYGEYQYPWHSVISNPNGESVFDEEVFKMIRNQKVLDVGCGHGEFTKRCSLVAKEMVGFDVTERFVIKEYQEQNISFIIGNAKHGLPFVKDEFDCAYIRKGPTSAYPLLHRVVKKGGQIVGLHPGDDSGMELATLFPNLFKEKNGDTLSRIKDRLDQSKLSSSDVEIVNSIEYLQSPMDVLRLRCFGQTPTIFKLLKDENELEISKRFNKHALTEGLPITYQYYIVRAVV